MSLKAVGYCRVSTEDQADQGVSLQVQEERIRGQCVARQWELIEVVKDEGKSVRNLKRDGIRRIIEGCKRREFDVVVVTDLSRLTRNLNDQTYLTEDVFKKNGIQLCSIDGEYDSSTAKGRLIINFMGSLNQYYSEDTGERTKLALKRLKAEGKVYGPTPIGKRKVDDNFIDHPGEQDIIREARKLRSKGMTLRDIRKSLKAVGYVNRMGNGFSLSVLRRMVAGG